VSGRRIELPSAQRQHLERGSSLVGEVSFDARHKPLSTNISKHFQHVRTLAQDIDVRFYTFMPLKRSASAQKQGPSALLVIIDSASKLSVFTPEGDILVNRSDLGHETASITQLALSPSQENHFVLTADDQGQIRVHNLKVVARKEKKEQKPQEDDVKVADKESGSSVGEQVGHEEEKEDVQEASKQHKKKQLMVSTSFSCSFSLPSGPGGELRKLHSVLPVDRGTQTYFVTGDSSGGISVFFRNGTMKGRVRVTEDPSGVRGLLRSQGQMILFYSSHSFGFFSVTQIDVQYPPCTGWNSPLYDVALESYASNRVILALSDGDVLVFSTARGKSKACDLTLKFPHVSSIPFKVQVFRGHVMALPTPEDGERSSNKLRELYFFNLAAMEAGYGSSPTNAVALQAIFTPLKPDSFVLLSSSTSASERLKSQIALRFQNTLGIELYDLSMKQPPTPKSSSTGDGSSWLNWFPKIGVFGVALVGVVIWNVRKVTAQRHHDRMDDFDEDYFKERLRERREKRMSERDGPDDVLKNKIEEIKGDDEDH